MAEKVCIDGFGRLGETLAGVLQNDFDVHVFDERQERLEQADAIGFQTIDLENISVCDTVFVCVPIGRFESAIQHVATHVKTGMLVMDVCSVKVHPVNLMQQHLPEDVSIIATHPLFGPDSIKKGYDKLTMVTHPVRVDDQRYKRWDGFWRGLGLNVIEATPEEHDRVTAYTLGMTHFFGRIMDELQLTPQDINTISYDALIEVMRQTNRDTWELFRDMQRYNPFAKEMRDNVYRAIQTVEAKLDDALAD